MSDASERSEEATPKRRKELREKGELATSQDFTAWFGIGAAGFALTGVVTAGTDAGVEQLLLVDAAVANPDAEMALTALNRGFDSILGTVGPLFAAAVVATLAAAVLQGGIRFRKSRPHYEQFNLLTGLKRTFGTHALWEGAKALLKTAVVAVALTLVALDLVPTLMSAGGLPLGELMWQATRGMVELLRAAVIAGLALALADVLVVARRNRKKSRMTKKEVADEMKNSDGDPFVRSQRRARQLAMSRNRMIASVADADVVLVNPTHIAVALQYEPGRSAPRVVARGSDEVAARIREEAEANRVPIVKDIPLARTLHAECEVGAEVPAELYTAVARVLAFVMALKQRGTTSGIHIVPAFQQRLTRRIA
ncbi:EscU/YscU/HrcU family type III secretion system export apparatus switch protein [Herbiconiux sp. SYSU D00978]|uniref:EscU/YscU/HrcU family type III secretion system export apparatus switch protein n=1 Tax=Herbiconiux sp. SYSU D00978 TaxID=2812562 RepID=UPI001A977C83|nr:EscU/YscU/HrcU family type III secretion system export apparatus switch protein [Herbiconiux sp. SYSU D00978]